MKPWTKTPEEICQELDSDRALGLSPDAAGRRLKAEGRNVLPKKGGISKWLLFWRQFSSMIVWLLIGAAIVAGFLGEGIDAWAIVAIVILNACLGFFQEYRAEKSLEALQKLSAPTAKVVRGRSVHTIDASEVVQGDLVLLEAGDRVPADGRLIASSYLSLEEAPLTGESVPVSKGVEAIPGDVSLQERTNMVFMGTVVAAGKGRVLITATGQKTEIGQIASELATKKKEETPLQKKLDQLGRKLVYLCLLIVAMVFGLGLLRGSGLVEMLLVSLSLAVAAIPEGLPAAVTISLSIGVRAMAEKKALVRRLSSVETLGSTSVICTDKTGTLTQNAMTVRELWLPGNEIEVTGTGYAPEGEFLQKDQPFDPQKDRDLQLALEVGLLCNGAHLKKEGEEWGITGDPTEGALLTLAAKAGMSREELHETHPIIEEIPFDSERKRMSVLTTSDEGNTLYVKGAPDVLLDLSHKMLVDGKEVQIDREQILSANQQLAAKAYRVIAVAYRRGVAKAVEEDLVFVGLIAMIDPPRDEVTQAVEECREAGIRVVMVTGDHKETAIAIARELNLFPEGSVALDGKELDGLDDDQLNKALDSVTVFSRITAQHKLRIVHAYKQLGWVTAMTGDGVNDAPAVQSADIGISMGITGTDVTKESSDMVILDDNFASIETAVRQGRGIYDNIVKFVSYLLSSNVAEILVIFLTMLIGFKTPEGLPFVALLPIQLLWMNLVTDGFPAISLALDPIAPGVMKQKPRPPNEEILNKRFVMLVLSISSLVTVGAIGACLWGLRTSAAHAHTMTFTTLIVLELARAQMIRQQYKIGLFSNPYLLWALASSFVLQIGVVYIPFLQTIFGTTGIALTDWGLIAGITAAIWILGSYLTKRLAD